MNVTIINCFDTYEHRVDLINDYFVKNGHSVSIIVSDFRHFQKVKRTDSKKNYIFISAKPYYKNMSLARLTSHAKFANDVFKVLDYGKIDLLYVLLPPNSLAEAATRYKRDNPNVKLIFDLIDLWPETMPIGRFKRLPPFIYWKGLRNKYLGAADYVISECDLFLEVLKDVLNPEKTKTIHLAREVKKFISKPKLDEDIINLCYLGSINNIIDIPMIAKIIEEISKSKPVNLHIIGDGEKKDRLIRAAEEVGANVFFYGKVFDADDKQKIFDICHFGLNIMKKNVCVGLSMKSIDYFEAGLPIINNIKSDTERLVKEYDIGINLDIKALGEKVLNKDANMRKNTRAVFEKYFSIEAFEENLELVFNNLDIEGVH